MKTFGTVDKLVNFHYEGSNVHTKSAIARFKIQHFHLILFSVFFIVSQLMFVLIISNTQLKSVSDNAMKERGTKCIK